MTDKPLVIQITKDDQGWPVGTEVGVDSFEAMKDLYPGAKVLRHQDGTPVKIGKQAAETDDDGPKDKK